MRAIALGVLLLAPLATAQSASAPKKTPAAKSIKPLPKGQTRVFEAVVMKVVGVAQARAGRKAKWKKLKVSDVLKPGVLIRTGRKSMVALRVGPNATLIIDRQTRVAIPQIVQDGDTLKTRVGVEFGRVDVKASRIGLAIDFAVSTPTSTLAVRGTAFRISWDSVHGARTQGVPNNRIRAIEMAYARKVKAALSKSDTSSDEFPLPAIDSFWTTYIVPLQGAITPEVLENPRVQPTDLARAPTNSGLNAANKLRGSKLAGLDGTRETGSSPPPPTDGQ